MIPRVSIVVNCDTRKGWLDMFTGIKDYGDSNLCGCRSSDFLLEGVQNKIRFFEGCELEVVLFVDVHEQIPPEIMDRITGMRERGEITKLILSSVDHSQHRWNDRVFIEALRHATFDYVAHFDGDAAAFRRPRFPLIENYLRWLDEGYKFICQQTPLSKEQHKMEHASTRFFLCKRETLDLDESERLLDDRYRAQKYPGKHLPCFEHILGEMSGSTVFYPPSDNDNFVVVNWVHYWRGVLGRLNRMPYDDVKRYIFETCGGPHGASDLIASPDCHSDFPNDPRPWPPCPKCGSRERQKSATDCPYCGVPIE